MISNSSYKHSRLDELSTKNISEIDTEYDLRGFVVLDGHKNEIGRVIELLYDIQSKKLRYLVLEITSANEDDNLRQVLAPIGTAELHEDENYLFIPALNSELIYALPDYEKGHVNPGVENMVRLAYAGEDLLAEGSGLTGNDVLNEDEDFYSHLHFDLKKLFGKNKIQAQFQQTLSGVFDDSLEAENAISDLIKEGFSQHIIELSSALQAVTDSGIDESITGGGNVVTVKIQNTTEALKASEIMNINGSVSVYESSFQNFIRTQL